MKETALHGAHVEAGGKMVEFGGWHMPLNYGSQIAEHEAVRGAAGMFDVSHMTIVDVQGDGGRDYLRRLLANDVDKLKKDGAALYGAMLNENGGIIDDLIVYRTEAGYRVVVNAATRDKDLAWMSEQCPGDVTLSERTDTAMVAVQGPTAIEKFVAVTGLDGVADLRPFSALADGGWLIGRTGYTGEDGVEVMLPNEAAITLWGELRANGVQPAGLAARDTLRLEAGLNLYGQDMTETTHPYESNIGWTVSLKDKDRQFIGRAALEAIKTAGSEMQLTGIRLLAKGVMRHDCEVHTSEGQGVITSGIFSPTLGYSIGLARVPSGAQGACEVQIRNKRIPAELVAPPFVRNGEAKV